jgi:hypothetical protein
MTNNPYRPSFNGSNINSNLKQFPSIDEFNRLQQNFETLLQRHYILEEEVNVIKKNYEKLDKKFEQQTMYEESKKNLPIFLVDDFRKFLFNDFQKQISNATSNYSWVQQIRLFHFKIVAILN